MDRNDDTDQDSGQDPGSLRIGIDLGGTKIEGIVIDAAGRELRRERVPTPRGDYEATLAAVAALVTRLECTATNASAATHSVPNLVPNLATNPATKAEAKQAANAAANAGANATVSSSPAAAIARCPVGIGMPGAVSPATGLIKNANSTWLNGRAFSHDIACALGRPVRVANDADCFALSEATDGAAAGAPVVFGVIVGTGTGGGIVVHQRLCHGPNAIAGEWGHNMLPWPREGEWPGPVCYCGRTACIETFLSGPGLERDYAATTGLTATALEICRRAEAGDAQAEAAVARYEHRMARGLASVINVLDPTVIVLGGGMSNVARLYESVPRIWNDFVFSDRVDTRLVRAAHGDSSGVRGAAWLWQPGERPAAGWSNLSPPGPLSPGTSGERG